MIRIVPYKQLNSSRLHNLIAALSTEMLLTLSIASSSGHRTTTQFPQSGQQPVTDDRSGSSVPRFHRSAVRTGGLLSCLFYLQALLAGPHYNTKLFTLNSSISVYNVCSCCNCDSRESFSSLMWCVTSLRHASPELPAFCIVLLILYPKPHTPAGSHARTLVPRTRGVLWLVTTLIQEAASLVGDLMMTPTSTIPPALLGTPTTLFKIVVSQIHIDKKPQAEWICFMVKLQLNVITHAELVSRAVCPKDKGYVQYDSHQPPLCLRYLGEILEQLDAVSRCEEDGAKLVRVKTTEVYSIVQQIVNDASCTDFIWIGADDRAVEGQFVWSDGTSLTRGAVIWRAPSEGYAGAGENCVCVSTTQLLVDCACHHPHSFICQYDI
ncbi:hypothetical protein BaRGS_00009290 [Batillaria attramentaria]|uniref:C-type lectin domain-containing protein n=1 Tax=Batillaria attramentaria TaxID=370345 RepID=A0ABD0LKK8_9CAEN